MSGPDHSPWKPLRANQHGSGPTPLGDPSHSRAQSSPQPPPQTPPPPIDSGQGPWRAPADSKPGPWRAPAQGPAEGAPPSPGGPLKTNLLGAISLVLALIGIAMSLYPPIMHFGWLTLLITLALGVVALFPKGQTKGVAIAGIVTSVVGLGVALVFTLLYGGALLWGLYQFSTTQ